MTSTKTDDTGKVDDGGIVASADQNEATPSNDPRSEVTPGVRTEAEVIADARLDAERHANEAPPGATGSPLAPEPLGERDDTRLVHYERITDGEVQSVNFGTREHHILDADGEWRKTTRTKANAAAKKDPQ